MTEATIFLGNGGQMAEIRDGEAALVLTSPPYFPDDLEARLRSGRLSSDEIELAEAKIRECALSLRQVFAECRNLSRVISAAFECCPDLMVCTQAAVGQVAATDRESDFRRP